MNQSKPEVKAQNGEFFIIKNKSSLRLFLMIGLKLRVSVCQLPILFLGLDINPQ